MAAGSQKDWSLSQSAFRRLLSWLDEGVESGGEKYLETRRRLVQYFDRKNCLSPNELADETLNRIARRLAEEGAITGTPPLRYCYIVAKFVFLEYYRRPARAEVSLDGVALDTPHVQLVDDGRPHEVVVRGPAASARVEAAAPAGEH